MRQIQDNVNCMETVICVYLLTVDHVLVLTLKLVHYQIHLVI